MNKDVNSSLRFLDYVVEKIEFYVNSDFREETVNIDFNIKKDIIYLEDEMNTMHVILDLSIFENPVENNYPFNMKVLLKGIFQLDGSDADNRETFAEINSIAILFPYLRSLVSTYTANANIQPLILPPINVVKLLQENA